MRIMALSMLLRSMSLVPNLWKVRELEFRSHLVALEAHMRGQMPATCLSLRKRNPSLVVGIGHFESAGSLGLTFTSRPDATNR